MNFGTMPIAAYSRSRQLVEIQSLLASAAPNTAYSLFSYPLLRMVASPKIRFSYLSARSQILVVEYQNQICKSSSKRKDELNGQK